MLIVAQEYLNGTPKVLLAERMGITVRQVNYYLGVLTRRWRAKSLQDITEAKAQELARLLDVERQAFIAYKASKREQIKYITAVREVVPSPPRAQPVKEPSPPPHSRKRQRSAPEQPEPDKPQFIHETREERITGVGDPRYLKVMLECIDRRCRLLGLDAPIRISWEEMAKRDGYDPEAIADNLEQMIFNAMVESKRNGGVEPGTTTQ